MREPGGVRGGCRFRRLFPVDLVLRTEAGKLGAGGLCRGRERGCDGKALAVDGLDPTAFEKALGKGRACREVGGAAEIGEEDTWPPAGCFKDLVGAVAQQLEPRRKPRRCQRRKTDGRWRRRQPDR